MYQGVLKMRLNKCFFLEIIVINLETNVVLEKYGVGSGNSCVFEKGVDLENIMLDLEKGLVS